MGFVDPSGLIAVVTTCTDPIDIYNGVGCGQIDGGGGGGGGSGYNPGPGPGQERDDDRYGEGGGGGGASGDPRRSGGVNTPTPKFSKTCGTFDPRPYDPFLKGGPRQPINFEDETFDKIIAVADILNTVSVRLDRELAVWGLYDTTIREIIFSEIVIGSRDSVSSNIEALPNQIILFLLHTHGAESNGTYNDNAFSPSDIISQNARNGIGILATPSGSVYMMDKGAVLTDGRNAGQIEADIKIKQRKIGCVRTY